jgi:hypothetical protein
MEIALGRRAELRRAVRERVALHCELELIRHQDFEAPHRLYESEAQSDEVS